MQTHGCIRLPNELLNSCIQHSSIRLVYQGLGLKVQIVKLRRTIYRSQAHRDVVDDPPTALTSILTTSSRNNACSDVTGALLYCGGMFLQVLEGPAGEVAKVLQRVSSDRRHKNLQIILDESIANRSFAHWSMCGAVLSPLDKEIVETLKYSERFSMTRLKATDAMALLECVQRIQSNRKVAPDSSVIHV